MRRAIVTAILLLLAACSREKPAPRYETQLQVREVMDHVLDPAARAFWASSGTIITAAGDTDLSPTTDAGWMAAENAAATVAESGNLLMLPGRARDEGAWLADARALTRSGLAAKQAAETRNRTAMFATGGQIYQACTACHRRYLFGEK